MKPIRKLLVWMLAAMIALTPVASLAEVLTGTAYGMLGDVVVEVTMEDGKIANVAVTAHSETDGIGTLAVEQIPAAIVEAQSTAVDSVAGATITSDAIKKAVDTAINGTVEEAATVPFADDIDVIVVGAGMAGLMASSRAAELGANVLVIEKTGATGGSSNFAGGSLVGVNSNIALAAGLEDSPDMLMADFVRIGGAGNNNEELARVYSNVSGEAINWVAETVKVPMNPTPTYGGYTPLNVPRVHYSASDSGKEYSDVARNFLQQYIDAGNACLLLETTVTELLTDENGDVTGVAATDKAGVSTIYNAPSIIIATGGYGGNEEVLKKWNFDHITTSSPACVSGDGYVMLEKLGVAFTNMDFCTAYGGSVPVSGFNRTLTFSVNNGALWVDINAQRLANEPAADSNVRSSTWSNVDENIVYMLFNEKLLPDTTKLFSGVEDGYAKVEELIGQGYAFKADTIAELAAAMGVDAAALEATVAEYNAGCESGADKFGRTDNLTALAEGPFYAVYTVPYVLITSGGPYVTPDLEPVTTTGEVIENVYLAGEIVGMANIGGLNSIGGMGHGMCITFGKHAAELAVANAGK